MDESEGLSLLGWLYLPPPEESLSLCWFFFISYARRLIDIFLFLSRLLLNELVSPSASIPSVLPCSSLVRLISWTDFSLVKYFKLLFFRTGLNFYVLWVGFSLVRQYFLRSLFERYKLPNKSERPSNTLD